MCVKTLIIEAVNQVNLGVKFNIGSQCERGQSPMSVKLVERSQRVELLFEATEF